MTIIFSEKRGDLAEEPFRKWTESLCHNVPASFGALCVTEDGIAFPWLCYNAGELSGIADVYDENGLPVTVSYVSSVLSGESGEESSGTYDLKPIDFPVGELKRLQESLKNASRILRIEKMSTPFLKVLERLDCHFGHIPAVRDIYNEGSLFWKSLNDGNSSLLDIMYDWNSVYTKTRVFLNDHALEKRQAHKDVRTLCNILKTELKVPKPKENYLSDDLELLKNSKVAFATKIRQLHHEGLQVEQELCGHSFFPAVYSSMEKFKNLLNEAITGLGADDEHFGVYEPDQRKELLDLLNDMEENLSRLSI